MRESKKVIALVFPPVPTYSRKLTNGIVERHMAQRDWTILEMPRMIAGESPFARGEVRPDGVITWAEARDLWVHDLIARKVPVVNCGTEWVGVEGVASVQYRFSDIQQAVVSHFKELGFKRIVMIGHLLDKRPATKRILQSFVDLASQSGMESTLWELDGEDSPGATPSRLLATEGEAHLTKFLKALPKPAALFCSGDHIGFLVARVATKLGIRIPGSIAIAGFGDNLAASFADPPLTTFGGAAHEVGRAAAECMASWLQHGRQPFDAMDIAGVEVIERESTVGKSGSVTMEAVRRFIDTHAKTGITLDELVTVSGLSVKTLVRKYKEAFGLDPMDAIHLHRIMEAKRMLENPALPISEVARLCGFSSQAAFANYFHRHAGCAPGNHRKQHPRDDG